MVDSDINYIKIINLNNRIIKILKKKRISIITNAYFSGIISMPFINAIVALVIAALFPLTVLFFLFSPSPLSLFKNAFVYLPKNTFLKYNSVIPTVNNKFKISSVIEYFISRNGPYAPLI